jgi:hypothetical protein
VQSDTCLAPAYILNAAVRMQAMVDAATERNTAQCLLMTPKLLPQLEYSKHVNVLSIVNGAYVSEPHKRLKPSAQLKTLLGVHAPAMHA